MSATFHQGPVSTVPTRDSVHVLTADASEIAAGIDLVAKRYQHFNRRSLAAAYTMPKMFPDQQMFKAVDGRGRTLAIGEWSRPAYFADGWIAIHIAVVRRHEGHGVGTALRSAVLEALPAGTTKISTVVIDDDAQSLKVARHWGFAVEGHPIRSEYHLPAAATPAPPRAGVTVEDCPDLQFHDRDAVEAMLTASNTSPGGTAGMRMDLEMLSASVDATSIPVGALVRVHGVPAGICFGAIEDDALSISYTGVQPRFRGQGLGRLLKEAVHTDAARQGATAASPTTTPTTPPSAASTPPSGTSSSSAISGSPPR